MAATAILVKIHVKHNCYVVFCIIVADIVVVVVVAIVVVVAVVAVFLNKLISFAQVKKCVCSNTW